MEISMGVTTYGTTAASRIPSCDMRSASSSAGGTCKTPMHTVRAQVTRANPKTVMKQRITVPQDLGFIIHIPGFSFTIL
jgi:hypothetical protein